MALRPRFRALRLPAALAVLALGLLACRGSDDPAKVVVAEVGDTEITADHVAEHMASRGYGVNRESVARAVDELIDFELVKLRARERYVPTRRDSFQMREWSEILLINQYRDDVIFRSISVDEAKLRAWYEENVGEEARVRHILIRAEPSMSDAEKQAARQKADSLLAELKKGADFAALAREHSGDPGSGQNGGLLPWFGKGQMVPPFEQASFEGKPGELYPSVVESDFGYHIIRIEERRRPKYEDLKEDIEDQLTGPQKSEAEQAYIRKIMETSQVEFVEHNIDRFMALVRAQNKRPPTAEERNLPLATFRGGELVLGDIWDIYDTVPANNQRAIEALDQAAMVQALASLVQQRLLMAEIATAKTKLDTTRQRQLDERVDQLYMQSYLTQAAQAQLEVPDSEVRRYYDEHLEFYRDQPYEEVREQIRQVLANQRAQDLGDAEVQQRIVSAVADSMESRQKIVRHENRYGDVLDLLRKKYEEMGRDPDAVGGDAAGR